jgi:hypothetical protein
MRITHPIHLEDNHRPSQQHRYEYQVVPNLIQVMKLQLMFKGWTAKKPLFFYKIIYKISLET